LFFNLRAYLSGNLRIMGSIPGTFDHRLIQKYAQAHYPPKIEATIASWIALVF